MSRLVRIAIGLIVGLASQTSLHASQDSIGPNGINSLGLGLNGSGVAVGQVEPSRPGKFGYDTAANCCNDKIVPTDVFVQDSLAPVNAEISDHAMWVAGIIISEQTAVPTPPPTRSPPIGIAQQATLLSSAFISVSQPATDFEEHAAVSAQYLATSGADIRAINMSFGLAPEGIEELDGNSLLTAFIDWSASHHDILYLVAGNESDNPLPPGGPVPTDNFNGLTIAYSEKADGVFRKVGTSNTYGAEPDTAPVNRTFTDLIAPGDRLDLAGPNGTFAPLGPNIGTSFAAPHVTGTVALLQQHAQNQISSVGSPRWTTNSQHHQVMKSVLMNSADKVQGVLGMQRTALRKNDSTWFQPPGSPLDTQMGTGHLNASRALQQFAPGEFAPGSVPLIGWDYGFIDDTDVPNKYVLNQSLQAGDYISVTLAWDRQVVLDAQSAPFDEYKAGDQFIDNGFYNLDLYVLPAGSTTIAQAVRSSTTTVENLEHIFATVPSAGLYEIWVVLNDMALFASDEYGLAWWAGAATTGTSHGDYNGDNVVDAQDYAVWRGGFGGSVIAGTGADGNNNGVIDAGDYVIWRNNRAGAGSGVGLASVPEPCSALLLAMAIAVFFGPNRSGTRSD